MVEKEIIKEAIKHDVTFWIWLVGSAATVANMLLILILGYHNTRLKDLSAQVRDGEKSEAKLDKKYIPRTECAVHNEYLGRELQEIKGSIKNVETMFIDHVRKDRKRKGKG